MNIIFGRSDVADNLVKNFHYSGYIPANIQFCATMMNGDKKAIASVFYSIPASRWKEDVLELCRLVRDENENPKPILTTLISESVKEIRRQKKANLLVSFADSTHKHHGGIYQASSWNYYLLRKKRIDGFTIDDVFVAARTCNHRYGTSGIGLIEIMKEKGKTCLPHYDEGKHLYWKFLDNNGKRKSERLGLESNPYPKPDFIKYE